MAYRLLAPPVLTPYSPQSLGMQLNSSNSTLFRAASMAWPSNNLALFYPFRLSHWATAYQLLFWVGSASSGNIDVGVYDSQQHLIVSSGSTAMSATANTVQELNIADTLLAPGDYLLAVACSTTGGSVFATALSNSGDEDMLTLIPIYEQAAAMPLPSTCVPVVTTSAAPKIVVGGIQFSPTF